MDDIALLRAGPNSRNEAPAGPQHAGDFAGRGLPINDVHHTEAAENGVEGVAIDRNALGAPLQKLGMIEALTEEATSGKCKHVTADIQPNDLAVRAHRDCSPLSHGASPRAKIKDAFAGGQSCAQDDSVDHRREPLIDLAKVDVRNSVPNTDLPCKTFPLLIRIDHGLSLLRYRVAAGPVATAARTAQVAGASSMGALAQDQVSSLRPSDPPSARICRLVHRAGDIRQNWRREVGVPILPRDVRKALDLIAKEPARSRSVGELAAACGVARRTLEKHFMRFVGQTPRQVLRKVRLERVRYALLCARPQERVGDIAFRCGVQHLGRFAAEYRLCYGETPSATLRYRRRAHATQERHTTVWSRPLDRPTIAVCPFDLIGAHARRASTVADEISAALLRKRWIAVGAPAAARYHLCGKIRDDGEKRIRIMVMLNSAESGRHIWADRWDGELDDVFAFEERIASRVAAAVERSLRDAEIERVRHKEPGDLGAWELTARALPRALCIEPGAQNEALELLEHAIELVPHDPLPIALAAWCRAQRACHFMTSRPATEKEAARQLAQRAAPLNAGDPIVEALLGAVLTLTHDFAGAGVHCERARVLDGGCAWAWNRSGMLNVYLGRSAEAIECLQIARSLWPDDALIYFCSIGIGAASFESGRYAEAARWFNRVIVEQPSAVWINRNLAAALALAGNTDEARQSLGVLMRAYPGLTIAEVRSSLPHTETHRDRLCEALASLGMHP
jgi:TolB-like protein